MNQINNKNQRQNVIIGVLFTFCILSVYLFIFPLINATSLSKENIFIISRILIWSCTLLIYSYVLLIEKQKLLLWKEVNYPILFYIKSYLGISILLLIGVFVIGILTKLCGFEMKSSKISEVVALFKDNLPLLIFTCLTAGFTEEIIFRGYLLPRLEYLFKNSTIAILISSMLFGLLHFSYGTFIQVIGPTFIGLVFALHYQKYRNIKILILCHFLWDFIVLLVKTG